MHVSRMTIRGVEIALADELRDYASLHGLSLGECINDAIASWLEVILDEPSVEALLDSIDEQFRQQQEILARVSGMLTGSRI